MPGLLSFASQPGWPGQPSNRVGHEASPGYAGLTSLSAASIVSDTTYTHRDIDPGDGGSTTLQDLNNVTFIGCRFQSNRSDAWNVGVRNSGNITFSYCSIVPRTAGVTSPPGYSIWPSAAAGTTMMTYPADTGAATGYDAYMTPWQQGYQYGIDINVDITGPVTIDHCDIWGFGNAITMYGSTPQITITNNWMHDAANPDFHVTPGDGFHTDGPGYLNSGVPPKNVLIEGNTIASLGNTNAIAFQAASAEYENIHVIRNYLSGFGVLIDPCHGDSARGGTGIIFTDNTIATDLRWIVSFVRGTSHTFTSQPTNQWARNRLKVIAGTSVSPEASPSWVSGDNGKFCLPNNTFSSSDWAG